MFSADSLPPSSGRPILILEDDAEIALMIGDILRREGWITKHAATLAEGFVALKDHNPCIAVVDLSLPDGSGMNMVRQASARSRTGVIVVSGHGDETDRILGLEVGADDFISKPFSPREMAARVRALYRRIGDDASLPGQEAAPEQMMKLRFDVHQQASLQVDGITLDPARLRIIGPQGDVVNLTGCEANLLRSLIDAGDEPLSREAMAEAVLGRKLQPHQRGIDQLASNLRRKLENVPSSTMSIVAVRGKGYRLLR